MVSRREAEAEAEAPPTISNSTAGLLIIFLLLMLTGLSNIILFHKFHAIDTQTQSQTQSWPNDINNSAEVKVKVNISEQKVEKPMKSGKTITNNASKIKSTSQHKVMAEGQEHHPIAGLSCADHGGPDNESASEMIFWSDIPSDSNYKSPFYDPEKYITFEPDGGGWNNIRMAYETILVLAHAMGRTLVLPPEKKMYLLGKGGGDHKKEFSFNDFFHLDSIAMEHEGFNIITMEEFLKRKGVTGQLKDLQTGVVELPPDGITDWNGKNGINDYLRKVGKYPAGWNPSDCVAAIPSSKGPRAVDELQTMFNDIFGGKYGPVPNPEKDFVDDPAAVDGETVHRMREMLSGRDKICIYDQELQDQQLLHFKVDHSEKARMLTHFYSFVFFQDWKQDLWSKRFVRDHIRYVDEIVCAAARIVKAVRERARKHSPPNMKGEYDSWHVRRGDFQYKKVKVEVDVLDKQSQNELQEGGYGSLYIATDERNKAFFAPLKSKYDVTFLDDYMHLIKGVNPNYYGMLDQLVAYKGRVFFGTWFSTLSGYVNRMRGYYSVKHQLEGYEKGVLPSYYFVPKDKKHQMTKYMAVKKPLYMREFPVSWRDIDKSVDEM